MKTRTIIKYVVWKVGRHRDFDDLESALEYVKRYEIPKEDYMLEKWTTTVEVLKNE